HGIIAQCFRLAGRLDNAFRRGLEAEVIGTGGSERKLYHADLPLTLSNSSPQRGEVNALTLTETAAGEVRVDTPAPGLGNPAKFFEDLLTVRHPPGDCIEWFGGQEQDSLGHQLRGLAAWVVHAADQLVEHRARRGHDLRRCDARDGDA